MRALSAWVIFSTSLLSVSCASHVPATVTKAPLTPIPREAKIFVVADQQRERVVESLRTAELNVTEAWEDADYVLKVSLGGVRASKPCGDVRNVRYELLRYLQREMVIKGRGATGSCSPNMLDDMSRRMASFEDPG